MNIVILIVSILAGIIVLLLIIALFSKKGYETHREIIIHANQQKVFDYLKQIKNQDNYNADARMTAEPLPDNQTKVSWSTASTMKYPLNIMMPMIVKMLEKDMGTSLTTLKGILEK